MFQWLPVKGDALAVHYRENRDWEALSLKIKPTWARRLIFTPRTWSANTAPAGTKIGRSPRWRVCRRGAEHDRKLVRSAALRRQEVPYTATIDPWPAVTKDSKPQFAEVPSATTIGSAWPIRSSPR